MALHSLLDPKKKKAALDAAKRGDLEFFRKKAAPVPPEAGKLSCGNIDELNRRLRDAVNRNDLEAAREALLDGADPNGLK